MNREVKHDVRETKNGRAEAHAVSESSSKLPSPDWVTVAIASVASAVIAWLLK